MQAQSLNHNSQEDDEICSSYHNLDYDQFESGAQWAGTGYSFPLPRYRVVSYSQLKVAVKRGCRICSLFQRGMRHFWSDTDNNHDKDSAEHMGRNVSQEALLESESQPSHLERLRSRQLCEDSKICIDLQPGRSVSISQWNRASNVTYMHTRLEFFTEENDARPTVHPAFGRATLIMTSLDPSTAASLLQKWLTVCEQHNRCTSDSQTLPKRLIDISAKNPRLIETAETCLSSRRYITLSHRWGSQESQKPLTTTTTTYDLRIQGIDWLEFPRLFQDITVLARMLGCYYLWIDSLCIIQDDENDWSQQSVQMAEIYSNGYLNLAAASALNPSETLFKSRDQFLQGAQIPQGFFYGSLEPHVIQPSHDPSLAAVHVRPFNKTAHECVLGSATSSRYMECPLLERAWVYQERLLAPRTAFFARSELMWQCRESSNCECRDAANYSKLMAQIELARPDREIHPLVFSRFQVDSMCWEKYNFEKILTMKDPRREAQSFWLQTVGYYSWMDLTKESDRAYAIAGVAQRLQTVMQDTYLAGLWRRDLPRALLWSPNPQNKNGAVRVTGGIPSWSWMSRVWGARLWATYRLENGFRVSPRVQIIDKGTWCKTVGSQFEPVLSGQIEFEAEAYRAIVDFSDKDEDFYLYLFHEKAQRILLYADCPFDPAKLVQTGDQVLVVVLGQAERMLPTKYCLVLRPIDAAKGVWSRVGIAHINETSVLAQEGTIFRLVIV
ncbi:HET-domain-containing [Fusarium albosuccineum]|uniref:HET-domain-containing n=1 Tax=Fusarium albosuccineum TaxID=1237068 RepID=A0A8H4KKW9_9HYPO|nr:HET-domain-containing [Fusarium albosuccineum]